MAIVVKGLCQVTHSHHKVVYHKCLKYTRFLDQRRYTLPLHNCPPVEVELRVSRMVEWKHYVIKQMIFALILAAPAKSSRCLFSTNIVCLFLLCILLPQQPFFGLSSMMLIRAAGARCERRAHLHNMMSWQRLEPRTSQSLDKHSTTELSCHHCLLIRPLSRCDFCSLVFSVVNIRTVIYN